MGRIDKYCAKGNDKNHPIWMGNIAFTPGFTQNKNVNVTRIIDLNPIMQLCEIN